MKLNCIDCPDRNTCTEVCNQIERTLRVQGVYSSDWMGLGAFSTKGGDMVSQISCPICLRAIGYPIKKTGEYQCSKCAWHGLNPKYSPEYLQRLKEYKTQQESRKPTES